MIILNFKGRIIFPFLFDKHKNSPIFFIDKRVIIKNLFMANSVLDSVLAQYEKNSTTSSSQRSNISQEDRLKKYFSAILQKNEKSASRRIRILPTKDGSSPFVEVWYHEIQVNGQWVKLYDPDKNDNERSPLTEVYNELISTGKKEDKELASQYRSRLFYIVKVVDRDNEQDGVKFWRFKHNYKQEGVLDKILPIWKAKGDVTDAEKGRDLIIELTRAKTPQGKEYTVIQTIMYDDPQPLHEDKEIMDGWVQDELTWNDVYSKKPVEYLEAVAVGETPIWSSELKKYVYGEEAEISLGGNKQETPTPADPQANEEPAEDLPF